MSEKYECFVWLELGDDGRWGAIAAMSRIGTIVLQSRNRTVAEEKLRPLAESHGSAAGHRIRLAHLIEAPQEQ